MVMSILFGVLGIGLIIFGIKILLTGSLTKSEEAKIASYSKKGARTYKLDVYRLRSLFDRGMYYRFSRVSKGS